MKILFKNSLFIKPLTWIMAFTFICQNIAFSEHISSPIVPNYQSDNLLTNLHIPESYGKIEKVNNSNESNSPTQESPQVVLIRDVHCNYEAQSNIAKILNILINDHKIDMICIEGTDGGVDPSRIAAYCDDSKIRQKVTDRYLRNGLLTASEALSINRGVKPGFTIWGVENLRLYLKDYQAFRRTIETNGETTHFVKILSYIISHLKKKLYPEKLQKFDSEINKYEINEIPLTNFIKFLTLTKTLTPRGYPTLDLVLRTIALEEKIYFEKVENERSALIKHMEQQLSKEDLRELIQKSLLFKLGKISQADYYSYLEDYYRAYGQTSGLPFENLEKYFELVKLQTQIDETVLFRELEIFRESIYADLLPDENARQLHQLDKDVKMVSKIINLEATREDFEYYNTNRDKFKTQKLLSPIKILARINNISIPPELEDPAFLEKIDTTLLPPEDFYNLAMERDDAIVENFLNIIKKQEKKAAVLIVGGFHTDGIKRKLLRKGISLIVVTPILTKPQEDSRELYLARMMDERIKPEMILAKMSLGNLAPIPITSPLGKELDLPRPVISAFMELKTGAAKEPEKLLSLLKIYYQNAINTNNSSLIKFIEEIIDSLPRKQRFKKPEREISPPSEQSIKKDEEHIRDLLKTLKSATSMEAALKSAEELGNIAKSAETPEKEYLAKLAVYSLENILLTSSLVLPKGEISAEDKNKIMACKQVLINIFFNATPPVANSVITVIKKVLASPFLRHEIRAEFEDVLQSLRLNIPYSAQIMAGEVVNALIKYEIEGIDKDLLSKSIEEALTKATDEDRGVDINEILKLMEGKITLEELFEIAGIIGKQLNTFLGEEARSKGGRMIASVLRRVLAEIPEGRRIEERTGIEEFFKTIRKHILKKEGINTENLENGITMEEIEDGLNPIELGLHIINYDPLLRKTQIDASYSDYITHIAERLGINRETMIIALAELYFVKQIELLTKGLKDDLRRKIISEIISIIVEEKQWTKLSDTLKRKIPSGLYEGIQAIFQLMLNNFSGIEIEKLTLPDSKLSKAIARLKLYQQLEGKEENVNLTDVDLEAPEGNLDILKGVVEKEEIIRLLSTTYAAQLDLEKAYNELIEQPQAEPILQKNAPVVESIPASLFGIAKRDENGRLKLQLNNVGLTAFFKLMEKLGKNNVFLELRVGSEEELTLWEGIRKAMPKDLQGKISIGLEVKNANEALERRDQLRRQFGVREENIVIMTGKEFKSEGIESCITEKGLKIFGVANEGSLHSVLLFGLFYGLTDEVIVNNRLSDTILEALKLLGMDPGEIGKIKSEGVLFFTVKLIRIADTLKEFQNRKITIDVAA